MSFFQVTSVEKTFLGLGLWPRPQKPFSQFPFLSTNVGNMEKTQITHEKFFPPRWQDQLLKQNTIISHFETKTFFEKALFQSHFNIAVCYDISIIYGNLFSKIVLLFECGI